MTHAEICPVCYGRCQVPDHVYKDLPASQKMNYVDCKSCDAIGWVTVLDYEDITGVEVECGDVCPECEDLEKLK